MKRRLINSQLKSYNTYNMYLRQMLTLAENVFQIKNLPNFIDVSYINKQWLRKGSIAFFVDEIMGLLALPYTVMGKLDVYGRPTKIQVMGQNGYTRVLRRNEFVIIYDNYANYSLYIDILQYAERVALATRTIDINIEQQKTPRIFKTSNEKARSVTDIVNNIDGMANSIITYDDINLTDDTTIVLAPAPFVADKVNDNKQSIWNEFLRLIGITSITTQKKERLLTDEITAQNGGATASRYNRFDPRKKGFGEVNKRWGYDIEVEYYDGNPEMYETVPNFDESEEIDNESF